MSPETLEFKRQRANTFTVLREKKKKINQESYIWQNQTEIKTFPDKQKMREFITTSPALQKMLQVVLKFEMKEH